MTRFAADKSLPKHSPVRSTEPVGWKKKVSETLLSLHLIPENFNGKVVVSFKEGGVSFLEKTETYK